MDFPTSRGTIFGAIALLALLLVVSLVIFLKVDITPAVEEKQRPVRTRNFGEGLKLSQHGIYGVDVVSIGRASMRKLRKGPFTIGAINELFLEDVSLVLPEQLWNPAPSAKSTQSAQPDQPAPTSAKRMLDALGIDANRIKITEKMPRFSALAIRNIKVARIVDGTNVVSWFAASNAKAERAGLALYSGWSVENGKTNTWKEALLTAEPKLELHCQN